MATGPVIDYEALQQDAMRSIVRGALRQIEQTGLPGEHHFYISFLTQNSGVVLSKRLKEKYPHEMTIVLQHRFWDLIVTDERFEVKLTFDGIPERLVVPFSAIKVFIDPSVSFGLQFEDAGGRRSANAGRPPQPNMDAAYDATGEAQADAPRPALPKKPRSVRKPKADKEAAEASASALPATAAPAPAAASPSPSPAPKLTVPQPVEAASLEAVPVETAKPEDGGGAQILSLDKFRKK